MAKSVPKVLPQLEFKSRADLRAWLKKNHTQKDSIRAVLYKKHHPNFNNLTYPDLVEEGLCWGWIDSTTHRIDDDRYMLLFAPRKPKSVWSKVNKERVERLIANGLMAAPGLATIETAKANGSWAALDAAEELTLPADLQKALKANKTALGNFEKFPPSAKKLIYTWIGSAKREETRNARVEKTVNLAEQNIRAGN